MPLTGVLLIESGSRSLIERVAPHLRATWARDVPIDLLTCFGGLPAGLGPEATVYRTTDYATPEKRKELAAPVARPQLFDGGHDLLGRADHDQMEVDDRAAPSGEGFHHQ